MTGSKPQLYNGIALLATFFLCRLVWGTWQSAVVYVDMWHSIRRAPSQEYLAKLASSSSFSNSTVTGPDQNPMFFFRSNKTIEPVPVWLTAVYLASNLVLNALNWHWFFKMITAVRKRFEPAAAKKTARPVPADAQPAGAADGEKKTRATAVEDGGLERAAVRQRRAPSIIEDVQPDSEELREGTIQ
jgi:hypothetical protein